MKPTGSSILPSDPRPGRALPAWSLPVALLGLAILLVSTLPAIVARRGLEFAERQTLREIKSTEETTERLRRDAHALRSDRFVLDRAIRELLEPGPTVALPRARDTRDARDRHP